MQRHFPCTWALCSQADKCHGGRGRCSFSLPMHLVVCFHPYGAGECMGAATVNRTHLQGSPFRRFCSDPSIKVPSPLLLTGLLLWMVPGYPLNTAANLLLHTVLCTVAQKTCLLHILPHSGQLVCKLHQRLVYSEILLCSTGCTPKETCLRLQYESCSF